MTFEEIAELLSNIIDEYKMDSEHADALIQLFSVMYQQLQENVTEQATDDSEAISDAEIKKMYDFDYKTFKMDEVPYNYVAMEMVCKKCGNYLDIWSSFNGYDDCKLCRDKPKDLDWSDSSVDYIRY